MCEKCGDDNCDGSGNYIDPIEILTELYPDKNFFYLDDYNDAIVGISGNKLVYSKTLIIDILSVNNDITYQEAEEYYINNVENGYFGKNSPIFLNDDLSLILENIYDEDTSIPFSIN